MRVITNQLTGDSAMFISKDLSRRFTANTLIVTAVALGFLSSGSSVLAAEHSADARSKPVILTDLDLSTSEGQRVAYERLHQMARTLCSQVADELDLSHQANYVACVDSAMVNAGARLQALVSQKASTMIARNQAK
jgi:UrcA family protein